MNFSAGKPSIKVLFPAGHLGSWCNFSTEEAEAGITVDHRTSLRYIAGPSLKKLKNSKKEKKTLYFLTR